GALADARVLDLILHADHGGEARIDRNDADLALLAGVLVGGAIAAAVLDRHLDHERHVVGQGGDDVLGVDDLHRLVGDDVGCLDDAALVPIDANGARRVEGVFDHQAFDVQDDVGNVLDDTGDGADFVLHALDLDAGDGTAFEGGQQDAANAVAHGDAKAALERLDSELAVGVGEGTTVADHAVGQFQTTPSDTHVFRSP